MHCFRTNDPCNHAKDRSEAGRMMLWFPTRTRIRPSVICAPEGWVLVQIKRDRVTRLVVLPLYPQFSISTSGSSLRLLERLFR